MQVFLCWSGKTSHALAEALHDFIGDAIQRVKPFLSSGDIAKGRRWSSEIAKRLADCNFGILCLTKYNLESRWILFEAGALSKLPTSNVTAILGGIQPTDLTEPLSQFQHTGISQPEIKKLLSDINALIPEETRLDAERLKRIFEREWPALEKRIEAALAVDESTKVTKRDADDMIAETLELVRDLKRGADASSALWANSITTGQLGSGYVVHAAGQNLGALSTLYNPTAEVPVTGLLGPVAPTGAPMPSVATGPTGPSAKTITHPMKGPHK